jgi:hypothetical protein
MFKSVKLYRTILGIIVFIILIVGITYAYITWKSDDIKISVGSECFEVNHTKGKNISINDMYVINEKDFLDGNNITIVDGMALTTISLGINPSCNVTGTATIKLDVSTLSNAFITNTGNSVGALKYKVVEYSSEKYPDVTIDILKGATFNIKAEGMIVAKEKIELYSIPINNSGQKEHIIIFYLDEVLIQNDAAGASFNATIFAEVTQNG